jgi:hypothetical protein
VAEYTRDKDDNADIANLFRTKEYYPGQPVEIQLYHVDMRNPQASTLQPVVLSVPDWFLVKDGQGFTANVQGEDGRLLLFLLLRITGSGSVLLFLKSAWVVAGHIAHGTAPSRAVRYCSRGRAM